MHSFFILITMHYARQPVWNRTKNTLHIRSLWEIPAEVTRPHLKAAGSVYSRSVRCWNPPQNRVNSWGSAAKVVGCCLPALDWFQDTTSLAHLGCMLRWSQLTGAKCCRSSLHYHSGCLDSRHLGDIAHIWYYMIIYACDDRIRIRFATHPKTQSPK